MSEEQEWVSCYRVRFPAEHQEAADRRARELAELVFEEEDVFEIEAQPPREANPEEVRP